MGRIPENTGSTANEAGNQGTIAPDMQERVLRSKTNLIAVSAGNTRAAIAVFQEGKLMHVDRLTYDQQDDWAATIAKGWEEIKGSDSAAIVGASVNPNIINALNSAVQNTTGQEIMWIGNQIDRPVPILTDVPQATGLDRILNVAAAHEMVKGPVLVVDAGTAITIDAGGENGEFLGGVIGPGVAMTLRALHEQTAVLPQLTFRRPPDGIGKNTQDAMYQGVLFGMRGMVREAADRYADYIQSPLTVIATGGDAEALFRDFNLVSQIAPDLTLQGISIAYAKHLENNNPTTTP